VISLPFLKKGIFKRYRYRSFLDINWIFSCVALVIDISDLCVRVPAADQMRIADHCLLICSSKSFAAWWRTIPSVQEKSQHRRSERPEPRDQMSSSCQLR